MCHVCKRAFTETTDTLLYSLKHPTWLVVTILMLLACGCPR